jgi:uncharacterized membrane protein YeaQ/YmgE (transglycosylase-associated protein family)
MHIILMLVVGLIVGGLAKLVMPGKDPGGVIVTMLLGVAGAMVAGMLGWYSGGQAPGLIASVLGAVILLVIVRVITRPIKAA